jgi:hypothetical protein
MHVFKNAMRSLTSTRGGSVIWQYRAQNEPLSCVSTPLKGFMSPEMLVVQ